MALLRKKDEGFTGDTVTLNGTLSSDVKRDPLTYTWSFLARPAGSARAPVT